ncbi:MAG: 4-hydroxy-tetrahydrodipicolinate synthase [Deltaproteobacteria bacterium]|nr:4-hydroxy-tetrahydrodipicolinate synthase [Deltaproteobacteria bacterium]
MKLQGAYTALVTPFRGGAVDYEAFEALVEFQIADGISGVVPVGTTGESPTVTAEEARELVSRAVRQARGRVPVIAGTGSNSTAETVARTRAAEAAGAQAAMVVMPYYNKPTQRGLVAHVRAVHDATGLPLVLYNVPTRGTADLAVESLVELCKACPRVVGLKEATGNILRAQSVVAALGDRLTVLCGDDALTLGMLACGARGVISVTSNALPGAVAGVCRSFLEGDLEAARRRHLALLEVHESMFLETNPGPVKAALAAMGKVREEVRLPLVWPTEATVHKVLAALRRAGVSL